jgi:hypothetical protein
MSGFWIKRLNVVQEHNPFLNEWFVENFPEIFEK